MRRTHLRGHPNIKKRLLVHVGGFNLGLVMRKLMGRGTPRGFQGLGAGLRALCAGWSAYVGRLWSPWASFRAWLRPCRGSQPLLAAA